VAEIMEYQHLLDKANECEDPVLRMIYVTAFSQTGYANTELRITKPFNPLLGETYELHAPDFRYFAEQVSHHPPVSACFGESKTGSY
jgi:hypothetical protein